MTKITSDLLNDTLNLMALARETARVKGSEAQADRLTSVVEGLRDVLTAARSSLSEAPPSGILAQEDFKTLLGVVQSEPVSSPKDSSTQARSQIVVAMAEGGMTEVDIARQLGLAREEVRLMLSINSKHKMNAEGSR